MNAQTVQVTSPSSCEGSEDLGGYMGGGGSNIVYYFRGQACRLSKNGYLPIPVLSVAHIVESSYSVLVNDEQSILDSIDDDTDIYAQPSDMWCLLQNAFQVKIASEILHMDFCDYCSSALGLTRIARSIFDQYSSIGLTYSQFRREFIEQCPCGNEKPS